MLTGVNVSRLKEIQRLKGLKAPLKIEKFIKKSLRGTTLPHFDSFGPRIPWPGDYLPPPLPLKQFEPPSHIG